MSFPTCRHRKTKSVVTQTPAWLAHLVPATCGGGFGGSCIFPSATHCAGSPPLHWRIRASLPDRGESSAAWPQWIAGTFRKKLLDRPQHRLCHRARDHYPGIGQFSAENHDLPL